MIFPKDVCLNILADLVNQVATVTGSFTGKLTDNDHTDNRCFPLGPWNRWGWWVGGGWGGGGDVWVTVNY